MQPGDSRHQVINDSRLRVGELHRFTNGGGVPYCAIYYEGREYVSAELSREADMVNYWIKTYEPKILAEEG